MSTSAPGKKIERETYSAKVQAKAQSSTSCSFCWFVLTIYPTLKEMNPRDEAAFREHLTQVHGLRQEIRA